ncbi:Anaerobic dimethyl sulfoxide reductase chain B [Pelotomaculum schinkii]|uniref:Anaerobic dimethyl sulfoxide reductase chain B n=1 Tax=Pelotomaculum schinkii TaxID=78350 RepID=A0A4Y7RGY8_9FIRM|nr:MULTISPECIES: 4Fe-4S dicluster domain-containing protein [Pelotomaculum]TEB08086.1 Anaerobic dimethyl sulfoxide reductase chain B [Pelotomaculum schinkii]TEB15778.1 Anaerobic dimethyl sulfoxide reductase chain B [Pelotomaculum sp. FP]
MSKILLISPKKCNNCKTCEAVCSNSAVNVITFEEVRASVPVMCMQCEDAACMKVCPNRAISRDENDAVVVDPNKCIGCKMCISACPMGNIHYSFSQKKIMKCNLCDCNPACAKYCPTRAIEYVDGTISNINKKRAIASKFIDLFEEA